MYNTLRDLPAAKKELERCGFTVTKCKFKLNGRNAYRIVGKENDMCEGIDNIVTDYGLLNWASQ
jgi:hypothetical protein